MALFRKGMDVRKDLRSGLPKAPVLREPLESLQQGVDVAIGLVWSPLLRGVNPDSQEVGFRLCGESIDYRSGMRSRPSDLIRFPSCRRPLSS